MSLLTRGRLGEYLDLLKTIIQEGQEVGGFRQDLSAGLATNLVFGAVDELVNSWLLAEEPGDLTRVAEPLLDLLANGLSQRDR
jgi:TetR/AcrR family fatty acid metabolism transcriptional regulator